MKFNPAERDRETYGLRLSLKMLKALIFVSVGRRFGMDL